MAPPIGKPISVRQSPRAAEFSASPSKLVVRTPTASQSPQRCLVHNPTAAPAQAAATSIIRGTASRPKRAKSLGASGLRRHIASDQALGQAKPTAVTVAGIVAAAKNTLRAVSPRGRAAVGMPDTNSRNPSQR